MLFNYRTLSLIALYGARSLTSERRKAAQASDI
jgi:hypothetical protein